MPQDNVDGFHGPIPAVNPILALFDPVKPLHEKRKPGRPKKIQPELPLGHSKHVMSDDDDKLAESKSFSFPLLEQRRFQEEYKYETRVMKRSPHFVLKELAKLYCIDYAVAHACVKDLPMG